MSEIVVYEAKPVISPEEMVARRQSMVDLIAQKVLKEGTDYGLIPGTTKKTLFKPGAEKLTTFFGLSVRFQVIDSTLDWREGLFYFHYRCQLYKGDYFVAEGDGSCNSFEAKYRWRWIPGDQVPRDDFHKLQQRDGTISEFAFAVENAETSGKYGKPKEYWQRFKDGIEEGSAKSVKRTARSGKEYDAWEIGETMYRVQNPDLADVVNTVMKMAEKRALIAAVLVGVNASEFFTQDMEEATEELRQVKREQFLKWAEDTYDLDVTGILEALRGIGYQGVYDPDHDAELRSLLTSAMGDGEEE